jgi:hypothetical protein
MELSPGEIISTRLKLILLGGFIEQIMQVNGIYQNRGNIVSICNSMIIYSLALQLISRFVRHVVKGDEAMVENMFDLTLRFYGREQMNENHRPVLMKNLEKCEIFMKSYLVIITIIYHSVPLTAWIVSLFSSEYKIFVPIYLPYTDPNETFGFVLNMTFMTIATSTVNAIFAAGDAYIIFNSLQVLPMVDIIVLKLQDFGEKLMKFQFQGHEEPQPSTSTSTGEHKMIIKSLKRRKNREKLESQLINMIKEFRDYNSYVGIIIEYAEFTFFTAVLLNTLNIGLSFIVMHFYSIPIGIAYLILLLVQVTMPCLIGTMILTQNEKLLNALWSFPWYELSLKNQKVFLQFIHACQNAKHFNLLVIGTLNMELFMSVINGSYTYLMYILKFM